MKRVNYILVIARLVRRPPGTQLQLKRHCKVQMPDLQLSAGQALFEVHLVAYKHRRPHSWALETATRRRRLTSRMPIQECRIKVKTIRLPPT